MSDEVWGNVKDWGLKDHSDRSPVFSIDLVCGARVDEAKAARKSNHGGVTYYFCSKKCKNAFDNAPGEYLGQPRWPTERQIDINTASKEDLRSIFPVDDDGIEHVVGGRPYRNWTDFKQKNPGFSDPMLESLKQSRVHISPPDLARLV